MISSDKITVVDSKGKENEIFHHVLFGEIKVRTMGGQIVKCCDVHKKIKKGELPPLLSQKSDIKPMCLAWHTKGVFNPDCPHDADHGAV